MANLRVKKKHLNPDAVDGTKLKLLKRESVRVVDENDNVVDLVKLDTAGNVIGNGYELAKKVDLNSEISSREAALNVEKTARMAADLAEQSSRVAAIENEASARSAADEILLAGLDAETSARQAADSALQAALNAETSSRQAAVLAEQSARIAADNGLSSRVGDVETNLDTSIETLFENNANAYADGAPGVQDPNFREGWYFKNSVAGQKINWYFFDGQAENISLGDFSVYAVVTIDSTSSLPILAFYTTPTGSGDAAAWYKSRLAYTPAGTVVAGKKYLMYVGQDPKVHPELPRLTMTKSSSSAGTQAPSERILTASFGSNSSAAVNACQLVAESVGVYSPSVKRKVQLKIRKASQSALDVETSARQAAVSAEASTRAADDLTEKSARMAADAALQTALNAEAYSRQNAVTAEQSRAIAAEAALQNAINAEVTSRQAAIADLINSAPAVLDTLKELADALGGDENFASSIANRFSSIENSLNSAAQAGHEYTDEKYQAVLDLISQTLLKKEVVTITAQNVSDGYVTLAATNVIPKSMTASIDRLSVFEDEDFSLSVVNGTTRMTFLNSFAAGGDEAVEASEQLRLTYWSLT